MIVVDTSVLLAVLLNEPTKPLLVQRTVEQELYAPLSLHWEMGNALSAMLKRRRLSLYDTRTAIDLYQKIPLRFLDVDLLQAMTIAAAHSIYAYDAYFIVCAQKLHCGLLTLDQGLKNAGRLAGIDIVELPA